MSRLGRAAALAAALLAVAAAPAGAHEGNPSFRSVLRGVAPAAPGLRVRVLGFDNELQLTNRTGEAVVIYGYNGEPYARLLPDGTVQTNGRSPAVYLNEDRYGTTPVPPSANPSLPPQWQTQDRTGTFAWHDHRMHWMAAGLPPQVKHQDRKTRIFGYAIPLRVGDRAGAIHGTLYWVGSPAGFPAAAIVSLALLLLLAVGAVVLVRRRRATGAPPRTDGTLPPAKEAW